MIVSVLFTFVTGVIVVVRLPFVFSSLVMIRRVRRTGMGMFVTVLMHVIVVMKV